MVSLRMDLAPVNLFVIWWCGVSNVKVRDFGLPQITRICTDLFFKLFKFSLKVSEIRFLDAFDLKIEDLTKEKQIEEKYYNEFIRNNK